MDEHDYAHAGARDEAIAGGSRQDDQQGGAAHNIDRFVHEDPMVSGAETDIAKRQAMLQDKGYFERGNCYYVGRGDEDEARLVHF